LKKEKALVPSGFVTGENESKEWKLAVAGEEMDVR
jgi:hypothetical protein